MLYLILAVISSMLVSVLMRASGKHVRNDISMLACNYLMCSTAAAFFTSHPLTLNADGFPFTLGLGLFSGVLYLLSFMLLQTNVQKNGVVLSALFMKLGVLVPVIMAMLFFSELPSFVQTAGILLSLAAILLINLDKGQQKPASVVLLVVLLLGGGLTDGLSKVFEELGQSDMKGLFLLITFVTALVLSSGLAIFRKQKLALPDILFGLAIGIPNYFSSRFLLLSLADIPAVIAYPTYSVATIVLITAAGVLLFHERLNKRQAIAMLIILAGLVCLNL